MAKVAWLPEAVRDVFRLESFLRQKNPLAAADAIDCIQQAARMLERFPRSGRLLANHPPHREVFAAFGIGAYVLRYRLDDSDKVYIVRGWHSREVRH
ncbi:MAG: type II toxin-antitoxin system RelE/ParE family toxin [Myxococcota bacterium]